MCGGEIHPKYFKRGLDILNRNDFSHKPNKCFCLNSVHYWQREVAYANRKNNSENDK